MTERVIRLQYCSIAYEEWGCLVTFLDGSTVPAIPHPNLPHYHVVAHRCGYGDDLMAYCKEHEVCHAIIAEWFKQGPSEVLWALAHGTPHDHWTDIAEEVATQLLQRFVRASERPIVADVDWDALRQLALRALDPIELPN